MAATAALVLLGALEIPLGKFIGSRETGHQVLSWFWETIAAPGLRAAALVSFVLIGYPTIFGASVAPTLEELLDNAAAMMLFNLLFVVGLLGGLVPALRRHTTTLTMAQGAVCLSMVFHWFAAYLGITAASAWPGLFATALLMVMALMASQLGARVGRVLGTLLDEKLSTSGFDLLFEHYGALLAQVPLLVSYGFLLGQQLGI